MRRLRSRWTVVALVPVFFLAGFGIVSALVGGAGLLPTMAAIEAGRTLALALPTGSTLTPGQILHVGPDWYVVVEGAPERVLSVTPGSREAALRVAFEVGNRHFTLAIEGDRLLVPDDPAMEQLLTRLGVSFARATAVFVPVGAGHRHDP